MNAWAELLRLPALFTVPGDVLAGAAATATQPNHRTLLAIGSSLCLYEAGMALNDWADRAEDAAERPHRPLPSGRIRPSAALAAACAFTGAGLSLAACAGRPALAVAVPLAATVWAYDLALKRTPAGPLAMATARGLDLLLGAAATTSARSPSTGREGRTGGAMSTGAGRDGRTGGAMSTGAGREGRARGTTGTGTGREGRTGGARSASTGRDGRTRGATSTRGTTGAASGVTDAASGVRRALPSAARLGAHTLAVTTVSRRETQGGSPLAPLAALATTAVLTRLLTRPPAGPSTSASTADGLLSAAFTAAYAATAGRPYFHATLNPSPPLTQRAVSGGIRATIPLQSALSARSGATVTALLTAALAPLAARFARKVSVT
ncbi:SCO3242 family prenyltransferase [Streptomyces sp. NPDC050619]|uniref:SCO3242 family prenyltransferase n=1 Tax=Streptomyces sp. NPDC050619 TaxID=3157214 RepID=UPI00341DD66F